MCTRNMLMRQKDGTYKPLFGNLLGAGVRGVAGGADGASSETAPATINHDVEESSIPEDPQGRRYGSRTYRRRRRRGGEDWEERRTRRQARRQARQAARSDDLRIPDINDPNPTPEGGINY